MVVLTPFVLGTSPTPPPYDEYVVQGVLERVSGGRREGFAVVLCGKSALQYDTAFQILHGLPNTEGSMSISLTDSIGSFFLRVSSSHVDSLALAVVVPDMPLQRGSPFVVDASLATAHSESYSSGDATGCAGCSTEPGVIRRIVYYSYYFPEKSIRIVF